MAFDDTYALINAALGGTDGDDGDNSQAVLFRNATGTGFDADGSTNGNAVDLGRVGLPRGAQFTVIVKNPGGSGTAAKPVVLGLDLTLDSEATWQQIAAIDVGDFEDGFEGQISVPIERSFAWEQYPDTNIKLRFTLTPSGVVAAQTITADKIAAFITQGEVTKWGRASAADTLFV